MTNNTNDNDDTFDLPPELAELDREMRNISIEVRSSFGPELLAELERARRADPPSRIPTVRRHLIAAGIGALLLAGFSEPARASLARWIPWVGKAPVETLAAVAAPELEPAPQPQLVPEEFDDTQEFDAVVDDMITAPRPLAPNAVMVVDRSDQNRMPSFDREAARKAVLASYPPDLMIAGIGGTVDLRFWVTLDGSVDNVQMTRTSGQHGLDVAAMSVAQSIRFVAARRNGVPVGSWVDFPVVFEAVDGPPLAEPTPIGDVPAPDDLLLSLPADLVLGSYLTAPPTLFEAQQLLKASLGKDAESGGRWAGQIQALLMADPPADERPNTWRREATMALEAAMSAHPANPAPALALARIRRSQGMKSEARRLFKEGIDRASQNEEDVSSSLVAELYYEFGMVIQEEWQAFANLGRLERTSLEDALCPAAPGLVNEGRFAEIDDLLSLNMVCPEELGAVLAEGFVGLPAEMGSTRDDMLRAFQLAVEAQPTHGPANVEILLDLADQRRWEALLERAQAFVWETQGNPHGLLLTGLALERLGRVEQAAQRFEVAMEALQDDEVKALRSVSALMADDRAQVFESLGVAERAEAAQEFFRRLDPILTTSVNERAVEHLARSSYALLRFGATDVDPAQIWIRYGRPNTIRTFGEGLETRTEFWDYGVGPDLTFRREASSRQMGLTEGSATYADDLLVQFPHFYNGPALRQSLALEGQVSRFRVNKGSVELEITTAVPADLATGGDDELELSIFLLDSRGDKLSATRRNVPATQHPLHLRTMARPDAKQVVVELYNPKASVAASLREPVPLGEDDTGPMISDLFVLNPADPGEEDVRRTAAWVQPNIGLIPEGGEVGVLFELYQLSTTEDFALRVFLDGEDGTSQAVEFRPAGETEYRVTWRLSADGDYRTTEYITVNLKPFTTGSYTLTVRALRSGGGGVVEASRPVRIR
jgi:TonB family protein